METLKLPVLGREEDAVDDLATLLLIELHEEGGEIAYSAAEAFYAGDAERGGTLDEDDFRGEHSLDLQRFHAGVCLIYGSDPERYGELARETVMSEDEMERCEEEYPRKRDAWFTLLEPYLVPDGEPNGGEDETE